MDYFKFDRQGNPVPESNKVAWALWLQTANLLVAKTAINDIVVTTNFRGMRSNDEPELWQTEIRGSLLDGQIFKCDGNRQNAEAMHDEIVRYVKNFTENHQTE